jgi:hypothetical protein
LKRFDWLENNLEKLFDWLENNLDLSNEATSCEQHGAMYISDWLEHLRYGQHRIILEALEAPKSLGTLL